MTNHEFHPLANIFPMLPAIELDALAKDIAANGLLEPIVIHEDMILDGRNRYAACLAAGVTPAFVQFDGPDPLAFVISLNLKRRHLNESQRAMVAARLATLPKGVRSDASIEASATQPEAAKQLKVSRSGAQRARIVLDHGSPELIEAVDAGNMPVSAAVALSQRPQEFQRAVVERVNAGVRPQEAKRQVQRQHAVDNPPEAPTGRYRVIYADPPWKYNDKLSISNDGLGESYGPAEAHYPAMTVAELCALPIQDIAEDDAVLFLWVTSPLLEEAFSIIRAWGFKYKTSFVWDKIGHNMGHYNSVRHEFLLVCTRGSCLPDVAKLYDSVQTIERGKHSEKPAEFRAIIDHIYPNGSRVELFARTRHDGWSSWGNEVVG